MQLEWIDFFKRR